MTIIRKSILIIIFLSALIFTNCNGITGGTANEDIEDGLSSDYFIKTLTITAPSLIDPENPDAAVLNMKYDFIPGEWENELNVPFEISTITVTAETSQSWASMFLNDKELINGKSSAPVSLIVGENIIRIKVVAQDKRELIYTIHAIRHTAANAIAKLSALTVPGIELSPSFDPAGAVREFSANVNYEKISLQATASAASDGATVQIRANDDLVNDPESISLEGGLNTIKIICTSGDGKTVDTYTLSINRQLPSPSAKLANLAIAGGVTSEPFSPETYSYSVSVNAAMNPFNIIAQTESSIASITSVTVNSIEVTDIHSVTLPVGNSTIIITVTNDQQSIDYTLAVTCIAASTNANLKSLKVYTGTGSSRPIYPGTFTRDATYHNPNSVKFTKTLCDYVTVLYGLNTLTVTAIVDDSTSKNVQFTALRHDSSTNAVVSQSFTEGIATATINLDEGYVTQIDLTVTAGDNVSKQAYHLYAKLLNSDEFYWGIYDPSFKKSKDAWPKPGVGHMSTARNGYLSGDMTWVAAGSLTVTLTFRNNYNDGNSGSMYVMYNDGGFIAQGTQVANLKGLTDQNGWQVTLNPPFLIKTAQGEDVAQLDYHLLVSNGDSAAGNDSYTDMTYMGTKSRYIYLTSGKPVPFGAGYNWFESWNDGI